MSSSVRVLVLGSANGRLKDVFTKISSLNAKAGPFDIALCLGDLFGDEDEYFQQAISGEVEIPVSTYFTIGRKELPETVKMLVGHGGQVCENLFFLGRRGIFTTAEGLKLMFLGGVEGDTSSEYSPTFIQRDISALSGTADILITTLAPENVANLSAKPFEKGSAAIATLVQKINPRYHFAAEGLFYEREPYETERGYTRFLSLGNVKEDRWFYAFRINVNQGNTEKPPDGVTANPFKKREFNIDDRTCRICGDPSHLSYDCPQKQEHQEQRRRKRRRVIGPNDCFFCLSNVNVAKHLIVSIGIEVYLALAKGPLTTPESVGMAFPGHVLIIPVAHTPLLSPSEASEMEMYRIKLVKFLEARNCHAVTFEYRHSDTIHAHWQVIPVPMSNPLGEEFINGFKEKGLTLEQREPGESEEYCRVILPSGSYVATLPARFDLQLPRRILAKILQLEERQDWRSCIQSEEEERADASAFRKEFETDDQETVTQSERTET